MNRYPLWKYIVIAVALAIGLFYTLPNFFPEVPAVQVSSTKAKVDTALLATVEDTLKANSITFRGAALDATGIKVRFEDPDTQLKARDVLQGKLGDNYIVALNLLSTSPGWLASIGALPMYLGLDLRGGVHFLLQVDMKAALDKAGDRYATDLRSLMRSEKVQYAGIAREGSNVVLRFRDEAERTKARLAIEKTYQDLALRETESAGGDFRLIAGLEAGSAEAHPGRRRRAEHPDPAQPRERARRGRADHPAAGRGARRRAAAGRAGHRARQGHPRPHRVARDPHGQRRAGRARVGDRRQRADRQRPLHRARRHAAGGAPPGGAHRRPHQRCAAGLRPAQQRAGRAREPRPHGRAHLQGSDARERRQAHGDRAGREGQGRSDHGAGHPRGNRRRPRADQRPHDHPRSQRRRAADARRRAGGADGDRRGAHGRPVARRREHREGLQLGAVRLHRAGDLHDRATTS